MPSDEKKRTGCVTPIGTQGNSLARMDFTQMFDGAECGSLKIHEKEKNTGSLTYSLIRIAIF